MTKARDISSLIGSSGQIDNTKITLDVNEIPSLTTDKIPNLDAGKITTGTFADARISNSSVVQHSTPFDDNKLVNDISTLALRQASDANKSAYNTNSQSVDVFQDATGIDTTSGAFRNTNEYVDTYSETIGASGSNITSSTTPSSSFGTGNQAGTFPNFLWDGSGGGGNWYLFVASNAQTKSPTPSNAFVINLNGTYAFNNMQLGWHSFNTNGRINAHYWSYQGIDNNWYYLNGTGAGSANGTSSSSSNLTGTNSDSWHYINVNTDNNYVAKQLAIIPQSNYNNANDYCGISELNIQGRSYTLTVNATGNFTGTTITAPSSVSSMGAIITYQDQAGTNALNTDIVLQLSADGGSNYSTATLTALPDFSTGIKMAKVNDLAVTAGTQLKYKINFANQASGSKEARIRGVALQY